MATYNKIKSTQNKFSTLAGNYAGGADELTRMNTASIDKAEAAAREGQSKANLITGGFETELERFIASGIKFGLRLPRKGEKGLVETTDPKDLREVFKAFVRTGAHKKVLENIVDANDALNRKINHSLVIDSLQSGRMNKELNKEVNKIKSGIAKQLHGEQTVKNAGDIARINELTSEMKKLNNQSAKLEFQMELTSEALELLFGKAK